MDSGSGSCSGSDSGSGSDIGIGSGIGIDSGSDMYITNVLLIREFCSWCRFRCPTISTTYVS